MPVNPSDKNCVRDEMRRFKSGSLHSGTGKAGKKGPIVKDKRQALAIALSACGKSDYLERMKSFGFTEESADFVAKALSGGSWENQFETGKSPGPAPERENTITEAKGLQNLDIDSKAGKQKGNQGRDSEDGQLAITPNAIPRGNPQQGPRSLQLKGMRAFQETTEGLTTRGVCPPKKPRKPPAVAQETKPLSEELEKPRQERPDIPETQKAEKKRKRCIPANQTTTV